VLFCPFLEIEFILICLADYKYKLLNVYWLSPHKHNTLWFPLIFWKIICEIRLLKFDNWIWNMNVQRDLRVFKVFLFIGIVNPICMYTIGMQSGILEVFFRVTFLCVYMYFKTVITNFSFLIAKKNKYNDMFIIWNDQKRSKQQRNESLRSDNF